MENEMSTASLLTSLFIAAIAAMIVTSLGLSGADGLFAANAPPPGLMQSQVCLLTII